MDGDEAIAWAEYGTPGTRRLYERLGFTYDRPKGLKNCVMVKTVEPA